MNMLLSGLVIAAVAASASAFAQSRPPASSGTLITQSIVADEERFIILNDDAAKLWIGKPVISKDDTSVGEIAAFVRNANNKVTEMHADIGGFLGLGETRVLLVPLQFNLVKDRAVLMITAEEVKTLPMVR